MPGTPAIEDLQEPGALELLHSPDPARLAYTGRDGYPRVIPIGFLWNGTAVVVCTAPTAPKVAALAKHPHVALTIDTMGPPARELLLRGTASIEIVDGVPPEYLAAASKSTQGDELAAFEANVRGLYKDMARITITPSWARFYRRPAPRPDGRGRPRGRRGGPARARGARLEVDRRRQGAGDEDADLVVVVHELGDVAPEALEVLAAIAAGGPEYGVRLLVASERPVAELLSACPFLDRIGTRLVLQAASEEDSVALLGVPGAEHLSAGGHAFLRLEGRLPVQGWARRVSADRLGRLVHMMGTRAPAAPANADEPVAAAPDELVKEAKPEEVADEDVPSNAVPAGRVEQEVAVEDIESAAAPADPVEADQRAGRVVTPSPSWASEILRRLRAAPIRVRCFGAREAWYGDRLLRLGDPELLLLLAVQPITGIQAEAVADMLWVEAKDDLDGALRKERFKLRGELRRLVPEVTADPVPGDAHQGEKKVVILDTAVVSSDVHEFTELLRCAQALRPPAAIEAYEAALDLYRGDLLDSPDMPNYRWLLDADPQVGLFLRSDYRRRHKDARLKLAELLANGPESGLNRAEELYSGLCAEEPENEQLWTALFHIHERTGSSLGLKSAVRRLRAGLAELEAIQVADVDTVPLPPNLDRLVRDIQARIDGGATPVS